jgi:hypothetical protein
MKIPYHTKDIEALVSTQRSTLQSTVRVSSSSSLNSRFALPTHSNTTSPRSCVKISQPSLASLGIPLAIVTLRGLYSLRSNCTSTRSSPGSFSTSSRVKSTIRESISEPEPTRIRAVFTPSFCNLSSLYLRHHFIREAVEAGDVTLERIKGTGNVADLFTKPLGQVLFEQNRARMHRE